MSAAALRTGRRAGAPEGSRARLMRYGRRSQRNPCIANDGHLAWSRLASLCLALPRFASRPFLFWIPTIREFLGDILDVLRESIEYRRSRPQRGPLFSVLLCFNCKYSGMIASFGPSPSRSSITREFLGLVNAQQHVVVGVNCVRVRKSGFWDPSLRGSRRRGEKMSPLPTEIDARPALDTRSEETRATPRKAVPLVFS